MASSKGLTLAANIASYQPFNNLHYTVLAFLLAALTSCIPRDSLLLRRGILLLHIICVAQVFIAPPPSNVPNTAVLYTFGVLGANLLFRYFDRLYVCVPETAFHRINGDGSKEDASKLPPIQRFFWASELFGSARGIGWNWSVSNFRKSPSQIRPRFLRTNLLKYVAMYAGLYLTGLCGRGILNGFENVSTPLLREALLAVTSNVVFLYTFILLGWAITIYSHFGIMMLPLSLLCVGLQVGPRAWRETESWPPNFGSFDSAYSNRRFWGYTWHQHLRRQVSAPGNYLLSLLPQPWLKSRALPARLARRYFLVLTSFLVSGLIHVSGTYNVTRARGLPFSTGGELRFFLLQGVSLAVEDLVCWVLGIDDQAHRSPTSTRRWIGYAITGAWYVWSRIALRAVALAVAHGIRNERGPLYAVVELVERGAVAVPGNFVAASTQYFTS